MTSVNKFKDCVNKVWIQLESDLIIPEIGKSLKQFIDDGGGNIYKLAPGEKVPDITKTSCPALVGVPDNAPSEWRSNVFQDIDFTMAFAGSVYGTGKNDILDFTWLFFATLWKGYNNKLNTDYLRTFGFDSLRWAFYEEEHKWFSFFEASVIFKIQHNPK